jgi:hypothetical protein
MFRNAWRKHRFEWGMCQCDRGGPVSLSLIFQLSAKDLGEPVGFEVTCRKHREERCTRGMRFAVGGGREETFRKLKWWCIAGLKVDTKSDHTSLPRRGPKRGSLPTDSELSELDGTEV